MSKVSQEQRLLNHLKSGNSINPLQAWSVLGIYRLGARIFDLRSQGYEIKSELIEVKSQFGDVAMVANYSLSEQFNAVA